jgi:hypothetical protein
MRWPFKSKEATDLRIFRDPKTDKGYAEARWADVLAQRRESHRDGIGAGIATSKELGLDSDSEHTVFCTHWCHRNAEQV